MKKDWEIYRDMTILGAAMSVKEKQQQTMGGF